MGIVILLTPALLSIFIINAYLKRKGKKPIPENLTLPIMLFGIMWFIAYELSASFLLVLIFSGFGMMIGALLEHCGKDATDSNER
ncbi:MAG: hypothetical protein Q8P11_00220 [bacterium]|nr:hypothetical protein [bacterium]